jgi:SAM-dependent methyltransferase
MEIHATDADGKMAAAKRAYIVELRKREIDPRETGSFYRKFIDFMDERHGSLPHYFRFCNTFHLMLATGLPLTTGKVIMETGTPCPITDFLGLNGAQAKSTPGDLRYPLEVPAASVDIMLSFEVMEHIKDQLEKRFPDVAVFNESGVRCFAAEIIRILRPGGVLYLTTPNACSLEATIRILRGQPPTLFRPHVREYGGHEVMEIFGALEVESYQTHYSSFYLSSSQREPLLKKHFTDLGYSAEDRGDSHFFKFRKPIHEST